MYCLGIHFAVYALFYTFLFLDKQKLLTTRNEANPVFVGVI